jgi:hypothetical protein
MGARKLNLTANNRRAVAKDHSLDYKVQHGPAMEQIHQRDVEDERVHETEDVEGHLLGGEGAASVSLDAFGTTDIRTKLNLTANNRRAVAKDHSLDYKVQHGPAMEQSSPPSPNGYATNRTVRLRRNQ